LTNRSQAPIYKNYCPCNNAPNGQSQVDQCNTKLGANKKESMKIEIDLKNVHKDEIQELKKYLEENFWNWKQEKESMKKEFITNKENCTDNIYYMQDEENKIISIDTYSMELEAKHKLKKLFPGYKIESVYIT